MTESMGSETKTTSSTRMILTLGSVGLVASILLVVTYTVTLPYIEANQAAYLLASIRDVLPEAETNVAWTIDGESVSRDEATSGPRIFAGFTADSVLYGFAIEAQGQGYADVIRIIYGYRPDCACIIGMKVLESRETPGLGDKIGTDPAFRSNFDSLDVRIDDGGIALIKQVGKSNPWEIDAISGATISSQAITDILNASNAIVLPVIHANLETLSRHE